MRIITQGLGGAAYHGMITLGLGPLIVEVVRIIRGGRTVARELVDDTLEKFTIAAKLIEINGKELIRPIINRRTYTVDDSTNVVVTAEAKSVENKKQNIFSVIAETIKIKRGSDGSN
tara:strand:- start:2356 stop:2706 length:351 start_codon:yes stop_codon:yes gene_type:complete